MFLCDITKQYHEDIYLAYLISSHHNDSRGPVILLVKKNQKKKIMIDGDKAQNLYLMLNFREGGGWHR